MLTNGKRMNKYFVQWFRDIIFKKLQNIGSDTIFSYYLKMLFQWYHKQIEQKN